MVKVASQARKSTALAASSGRRAARQAVPAARQSAAPSTVTAGYVGDFVATPAVRDLRHPEAEVRTRHLDWNPERPHPADRRLPEVQESARTHLAGGRPADA